MHKCTATSLRQGVTVVMFELYAHGGDGSKEVELGVLLIKVEHRTDDLTKFLLRLKSKSSKNEKEPNGFASILFPLTNKPRN